MRICLAFFFFCGVAFAQEDQTPRPPAKDNRGLLKINRDFYELAASTGGDFYFWAAGEFAASNLRIPIEHEEVLLAYGSLETKRVFEIPVESGVRAFTLFAGVQRKDLAVLLRPDGAVVGERDEGTSLQSFQHMIIATINAPASGVWRLELHGTGQFCVTAHVQPADDGPSLDVIDLDRCEVKLSGTANKVQMEFVARDGSTIARPAGRCTIPDAPFRVAVTGVDANGKAFRRIERGLRQR